MARSPICPVCRHQTTATAGTILDKTRTELRVWFAVTMGQITFSDAGYLGIQKRAEHKHRKDVFWFIAKRPGTRKKLDANKLNAEKIKASIRAKMAGNGQKTNN
jgi:hypothetical protein